MQNSPRSIPEELQCLQNGDENDRGKKDGKSVTFSVKPDEISDDSYKLRDLLSSDKTGDDKDRVRVEHYKHDKSFKERLRFYFVTNQRYSIRWQIFRFIMKIVSCVLYVLRSVQDTDPNTATCYGCTSLDISNSTTWCCVKPADDSEHNWYSLLWVHRSYELWIVQTVIAFYSLLDTFLHCYLSYKGGSILSQIVSMRLFLEVILSVPFLISIFMSELRNIWIPLFLNCWLAKAALETMFNDLHRLVLHQQSALSQKVLILITTVVCILFTSVCGIHHLERASLQWSMMKTLWFVIVTFSTVGYGDTVPTHWTTQTFVMIMIGIALVLLPIELERLAFLLFSRQKEGGAYNHLLAGTDRHVVLCATTLRTGTLIDFLNEFYADSRLHDVHVVLLCPSDLDSTLRILLQVPVWAQRVTYLKGSALIDEDLVRARVENAAGCFILADRYAADREAADQHTILRTWAIQDFAPATPLFVQILKPENKFHVSFAEHVVCEDEIKHALLAVNCVCPGISTLVTLLLHTLHEQRGSEKWHEIYGKCAGNEIYDIRLGDSMIFRPYAYKSFTHAAFHAHKKYGVTLIGVKRHGKGGRLMLNPGPSHNMAYDDRCFYIAISSEEDTAFKKYEEPKKTKRLSSNHFKKNSFVTASSVALELRGDGSLAGDQSENIETIGMKHFDSSSNGVSQRHPPQDIEVEIETNRATYGTSTPSSPSGEYDEVERGPPRPTEGGLDGTARLKEVTFEVGDSRRSSASAFVPDESDMDSETGEMEIENLPSRIPNYIVGVLPVSPYIGRTPMRCHLYQTPKPFCCLRLNEDCEHREMSDSVRMHRQQHGGIIVSSPVAEAGLYNFILPLRAYHRPKITLKPIILLLGEEPNEDFLEAVCHFPMLYYMVGTINSLDNLLEAGCLYADSIVVVGQQRISSQAYGDEEHMADASTIVGVQTIYRLFPACTLIVELTYASNMRFMKFQAAPHHVTGESMASLRESTKRKMKERNKNSKDHLNYMFREPFSAGYVFSMSMIDTLLYQTFVKDYMITLISLLLGCEQSPGSGYLCSLKITADHLWLGTYGRLFQRLCSTTCEIPIGVYRTQCELEDCEDACPRGNKIEKRDINDIIGNRMKMLGLNEGPELKKKVGTSFVVVNPAPEFDLQEGDVIYLIRPTNMTGSTSSEESRDTELHLPITHRNPSTAL
ncbi:potassium channel subfamily T member 1 isoform X2 [Nematostella vectensis]|uniref:potassium channel subfamily T member 1 isoform X2 n=1 Tax=Nematostella vectensis TaxID=45351 RepID=UPI00207715D8|nr:potassium channel subfamily T member 1 isoform X2 [Nematostella vectensis]